MRFKLKVTEPITEGDLITIGPGHIADLWDLDDSVKQVYIVMKIKPYTPPYSIATVEAALPIIIKAAIEEATAKIVHTFRPTDKIFISSIPGSPYVDALTPQSVAFNEVVKKLPNAARKPVYTAPNYTGGLPQFHWQVHRGYLNELLSILESVFPKVAIETDLLQAEAPVSTDWVVEMFAACPPNNLDKLYRSLSMSYHPDAGGDNTVMSRINTQYKKVKMMP